MTSSTSLNAKLIFKFIDALSLAVYQWPSPPVEEIGIGDPSVASDQLRVVGGNLGSDAWAVWLPRGGRRRHPVPLLVIREYNFDDVVVAADDAVKFLTLETAAGVLLDPDLADRALDVLGVPDSVRRRGIPEPDLLDGLTRWSSAGRESRYHARRHGAKLTELTSALENEHA
jgi:hypothetical protein